MDEQWDRPIWENHPLTDDEGRTIVMRHRIYNGITNDLDDGPEHVFIGQATRKIRTPNGQQANMQVQFLLEAEAPLDAFAMYDAERDAQVEKSMAELNKPKIALAGQAPPGRNDPCPCGSNLKFKMCCGNGHGGRLAGL